MVDSHHRVADKSNGLGSFRQFLCHVCKITRMGVCKILRRIQSLNANVLVLLAPVRKLLLQSLHSKGNYKGNYKGRQRGLINRTKLRNCSVDAIILSCIIVIVNYLLPCFSFAIFSTVIYVSFYPSTCFLM